MKFLSLRTSVWALWLLHFVDGQHQCKVDGLYPDGSYCEEVNSWDDFTAWIDDSVPGDELYLCPFDIEKADQLSAQILWGLSIICVQTVSTDSCTLRGSGILIDIHTNEETIFQNLDFVGGDDHAVHISSLDDGDSREVTRTFCNCSFTGIKRLGSSRGGAVMTQDNAGIVNLFFCSFNNNFSVTRGAAVYSRTNQLNVIGCRFLDNSAVEWGGAIYCASEGNMYVEGSTFIRNYGLDDYSVIVKPRDGISVWTDGGDNNSTEEPCSGFFVLADNVCQPYIGSEEPVSSPPGSPSITLSPSMAPSSYADGLCVFEEDDLPCVDVESFADVQAAILVSSSVTFCGGYNIPKPTDGVLELSGEHDIRCISTCTFNGDGTHVRVTGSDSSVRVQNMKFISSDSSAMIIATSAANSTATTTTLCNTQFLRNTAPFGGAISIARNSGKVNVVASSFTNNEAGKGGAIYGGSELLYIYDSVFINNVARKAGSAIFTFLESDVVIQSSYFALNNVTSSNNFVVVVKGGEASQSDLEGDFIDAGENSVITSGACKGFFVETTNACRQFVRRPSNNATDPTA